MNQIVGVRYIGKKDRQEDTVCKTGAVWLKDQVHNFGADLAKALLVHTDSFEKADISMDGGTFLTRGKQGKAREVAAFINLTAMGIDQMVLLARREFNRVVNVDGKDEAQIRREVLSLMTTHNMDMDAEQKLGESNDDGKVVVHYRASPEEYAALMAGTVVLSIVPAEAIRTISDYPQPDAPADAPMSLDALLASLEKTDLLAFAKQEGVAISNTMTAEKLRMKIFAELSARSTTSTEAQSAE